MCFLGLWSGDRAGGGRAGVVNTDPELLKIAGGFLRKYLKQTADSLIGYAISNASEVPLGQLDQLYGAGAKEVKPIVNQGSHGKLVFTIWVHNSPLKKLFDFFRSNLTEIFTRVEVKERGSFCAGLFDAEGNINDSRKGICFRWSTKNSDLRFLMDWLEKDGFVPRYDGANVKIGCRKETGRTEFQRFEELPMLYIHHS